MSGNGNIRWRQNDEDELKRIAKNYNAKISRQRKKLLEQDKRFEAANLPQRVSAKQLRNSIETRKEFNAELARMQNYIRTGIKFQMDKNTEKSLHATVRDYNAKIDRLAASPAFKANKASLPEKMSSSFLIKSAKTKGALKANILDLKGFLKKGAEELVELPGTKFNIKLTKWQKESMEKRLISINAAREVERKEWENTEVHYGGKPTGYTQGQIRMSSSKHELDDMTMYAYSYEYPDLREKFRLMIREGQPGYWDARAELARINYMEKMNKLIGNHPVGKKLLQHIGSLPLSHFKRVVKGEDDFFLNLYELEKHPDNFMILLEDIWNEWRTDDMYDYLNKHIEEMGG